MDVILDYSIVATGDPAFEAVTLAEAKTQARVTHDADDTLFEDTLIPAAREQFEKDTGLAIVERTFRQTHDQPPCGDVSELKRWPVQSVETVLYKDGDDDQQTFSSDDYSVDTARGAVILNHDATWPATRVGRNTFEINFTAGYADAASVPKLAKQAILMLVAHWYANPEAVGNAGGEMPLGYERIVTLLKRANYP